MQFQIPIVVLAAHFVADFILQTDWMAQNKSRNWIALALHVFVYSAVISGVMNWAFFFDGWTLGMTTLGSWFAITFATHFAVDAVTSRINSWNWNAKRVHWFFVGLGADQLIHAITLAWTYQLLA